MNRNSIAILILSLNIAVRSFPMPGSSSKNAYILKNYISAQNEIEILFQENYDNKTPRIKPEVKRPRRYFWEEIVDVKTTKVNLIEKSFGQKIIDFLAVLNGQFKNTHTHLKSNRYSFMVF